MKYLYFLLLLFTSSCSDSFYIVSQDEEPKKQILETLSEFTMNQKTETIQEEIDECLLFDYFTQTSEYRWGIVNDGVMGGKSQGRMEILDNTLVFSGTIVTRGGGFSSLRGNLDSGILSEYSSVKLRAKSDGREYRITFRDNSNGRISHRAIIPFQTPGEFEEIIIPFTDLEPAYFGRIVKADPFKKESAREIGVILSDGIDGSFELVIDEFRFCR